MVTSSLSVQQRLRMVRRPSLVVVLLWVLGSVVAVAWAAPFVWMLSTSLKPVGEVMTRQVEWFPRHITFDNYARVLEKPVLHWLINSLLVSTLSTGFSLFTGAMAGYALARMNFPGRSIFFFMVLAALMIPSEMTIVPLFIGALRAGIVNNYIALVLPSLASVLSVYLFRQFFLTLPRELEDAAFIDGAGRFRTFFLVALPLAKPAVVAGAILLFTTYWNAFLWPLLVTFTEDMKTLPVGMAAFAPITGQQTQIQGFAPAMAAMTILTLPSLAVFLILQRHFIEGVTSAGLKG